MIPGLVNIGKDIDCSHNHGEEQRVYSCWRFSGQCTACRYAPRLLLHQSPNPRLRARRFACCFVALCCAVRF